MKTKLLVLSGAIVLSAIWGCGDSGGGNGTGVAGDTLVKDVTDAEVKKVCKWNNDQFLSLTKSVSVRQICTFEEAPYASDKTECKDAVADCVDQGAEEEEDLDEEACDDLEKPDVPAGCNTVTIADYETCVKTLASRTKKLVNGASCDNAGDEPDYEAAAADIPSQCQVIVNRCPSILPGFLQDDSEVDSTPDDAASDE